MTRVLLCTFVGLLGCQLSTLVTSQELCGSIQCDCDSVPAVPSWLDSCRQQVMHLRSTCFKEGVANTGYCAVHGTKANRIALDIKLLPLDTPLGMDVSQLNTRVAALYWGLTKGFDRLDAAVTKAETTVAAQLMRTLKSNVDTLFLTQRQATQILRKGDGAAAKALWRDYSEDSDKLGRDFHALATSLFDAGSVQDGSNEALLRVAVQISLISGTLHEHIGFASAQAGLHDRASNAWKRAAAASKYLMSLKPEQTRMGERGQNWHRQQYAARMHRASLNWFLFNQKNGLDVSYKMVVPR